MHKNNSLSSNTNTDKIVQLNQLVSQPQCLKLLILHTPFTLNLSSLPLCINLVKLDLSRNNLQSFPYLGEMHNLKFMFLHQNKLDIDVLIGIFQDDPSKEAKSALSKGIVWVTYWGNKGEFNARHYLANHTNVLAVDYYMVVAEERNQTININYINHHHNSIDNHNHHNDSHHTTNSNNNLVSNNNIKSKYKCILPFDQITNISQIFHNRKKFNKNATEQQYMAQFWEDMIEIRKKQILLNPVIRIQRFYRGWIYRIKKIRQLQQKVQNKKILQQFYNAWKRQTKFDRKLKAILQKKGKQHYLYSIKQMKRKQARKKVNEYCNKIRLQVINKKVSLSCEYKFFNIIRSNCYALKGLYKCLNLQQSSYISIHIQGIQQFKKYVIPYIILFHGEEIKNINLIENKNIQLRYMYEGIGKSKQFVRLLKLNQKSIANIHNYHKQTYNYSIFKCQANISKIFSNRNIHFSILQRQRMKKIQHQLNVKRRIGLTQLSLYYANSNILRDLVRGVYFYNIGYFTNSIVPQKKINVLTQYSIKYISSIIKIQKVWKGVNVRKKLKNVVRDIFTKQRAAIKIQRWLRNLPFKNRNLFMLKMRQTLKNIHSNCFYITMNQYMSIVNYQFNGIQNKQFFCFPEMDIGPYITKQNGKLLLTWNHQSQIQSTLINKTNGKKILSQNFLQNIFQNQNSFEKIKVGQQNNYQKCDISHIFHYGTKISIVPKKGINYLQVKCQSKYDSRFRILGIKLMTYQFNHNQTINILPKQQMDIGMVNLQQNLKKCIKNEQSIFMYQNSSQFQIKTDFSLKAKTFQIPSRFYINSQQNAKPIKYFTNLKFILVDSTYYDSPSPKKARRPLSYNQKFDVSNFLISDVNQISLNNKIRQQKANQQQQIINIRNRTRKSSIKNFKLQRKIKIKPKQRINSLHSQNIDKFNFMLDNPSIKGRLTTQPDLLTHQRSLQQDINAKNNYQLKYSSTNQILQHRKKANSQHKANNKNLDSFTKNFINQGNFIQNQFLYGQIKRLKTEGQKSAFGQVQRIKTQQNERNQTLLRIKQQKIKKSQLAHKKHKQQVFKSAIQKKVQLQQLAIKVRKSQQKQHYKSMPKRMRINFAQQCYPIIGKKQTAQINQKQVNRIF